MPPANSPFTIYAGEKQTVKFTMPSGADITGWTIKLYTRFGATEVVKAATITDGPGRKFEVDFTRADTKAVTPGTYFYDVWRTDDAAPNPLALGDLTIAQVARPATA